MMTPKEKVQKEKIVSGITGDIAILELGNPEGVPVLTLHGWLDNAASFEPLARCSDRFRWINIDLPGHGKSAHRPLGCIYHFTDYIADLHSILTDMDIEKCNLVGHSLGAGIAAMYAAVFPNTVKRLVLIDGIGPISGNDDDSLQQFRSAMSFLVKDSGNSPNFYKSWEQLVAKRRAAGDIEKSSVEALLTRGAAWEGDRLMVRSDIRLKHHSPIYMSQGKVLSILSGIEAPTLLILAKDGLVAGRATTNQRIKAVKNISVVTVEGHHHVHMDDPKCMVGEIENFLDSKV